MSPLARPLRRATLLIAVVALAAFTATSCTYVNPPVMTMAVSQKEQPFLTVTWDDLQKELTGASSSSSIPSSTTTAPTYYQASQIAQVLTTKAQQAIVEQWAAELEVKTTDADTTAAANLAQSQGSSSSQPTELQIKLAGVYRALAEQMFSSGQVDKAAEARTLYDQNKAKYNQICFHVFEVTPETDPKTGSSSPAQIQAAVDKANAAKARVGTETFEAVADDINGAQAAKQTPGGNVGCRAKPSFISDDEWAKLAATPKGSMSDPLVIQDQVVYVFRIDDVKTTFEQVQDQVLQDLTYSFGEQRFNQELPKRAANLVVVVDPHYGQWDPARLSVVPPEGAAQPTIPTTTTTTTPPLLPTTTTTAPATTGSTPTGAATAPAGSTPGTTP